jgi:hypothetical protein
MPLLALNTTVSQTMRLKYQVGVGLMPIGLMFASMGLTYWFAGWLAGVMGIGLDDRVRDHPEGWLWAGLFLTGFVLLMLAGYASGWLINAAISRFVLGWSAEQVRAVYLRSELPAHWRREGAPASQDADAVAIANWEVQRKTGALGFIAKRGVVGWGVPMFAAMYVVPTFAEDRGFELSAALLSVALWAAAGAAFGAFMWWLGESNHRKLLRRRG